LSKKISGEKERKSKIRTDRSEKGKKCKAFYLRVARWFVFKPKIPILVNFGGSCNGKSWYIFMIFWYII
jgi:hypothetical protein